MSEFPVVDLDAVPGESDSVDFKASFDGSKRGWCEQIKDIIAMANSGGGTIIVGVSDDGTPSGGDLQPLLGEDPANLTNRIHRYTDQQFAAFEIVRGTRLGQPVAIIRVGDSRIPVIHGSRCVRRAGRRSNHCICQRKCLFSARCEERTGLNG